MGNLADYMLRRPVVGKSIRAAELVAINLGDVAPASQIVAISTTKTTYNGVFPLVNIPSEDCNANGEGFLLNLAAVSSGTGNIVLEVAYFADYAKALAYDWVTNTYRMSLSTATITGGTPGSVFLPADRTKGEHLLPYCCIRCSYSAALTFYAQLYYLHKTTVGME